MWVASTLARQLLESVIQALFKSEGEVIIEDTPSLGSLLLRFPGLGSENIRVVRAPKLEILGLLSPCISEIEIANLVFQVVASDYRLLLCILSH